MRFQGDGEEDANNDKNNSLIETSDYAAKLKKTQKLIDHIKKLNIDDNDDDERSKTATFQLAAKQEPNSNY